MEEINRHEQKAGYNQSGRITEVLGNLRITYISCMMENNFIGSLNSIRRILDIVSGKAKKEDVDLTNKGIYLIEDKIPWALATNIYESKKTFRYPAKRKEVERDIETLYRKLEKLQDKYGYGMVSAEDPRLAVLKR